MSRKFLVCLMSLVILGFSSMVKAQDLCDDYHDKYRVCEEKGAEGRSVDYDACAGYTDSTTCTTNDCYWNEFGTGGGQCVMDVCLEDGNFDGFIDGDDLNIFKREYGRYDCPTTPNVPAKAPVERTGVFSDQCYDATGADRPCADTGEDGEYQKGVKWPLPRFADNGDGTLTDGVTGLMWMKEVNCIGTYHSYYDTDGTPGDGYVYWQTALDFVQLKNNDVPNHRCGVPYTSDYDDWRMPNIKELLSLMDYSQYDPSLPFLFRLALENFPISSANFWSSTTYQGSTEYAHCAYFNETRCGWADKDLFTRLLWFVREGHD